MCTYEVRRALCDAFREIVLAITGVFDLYEADPELVDVIADTLGKVFRGRLQRAETPPGPSGRAALEALLSEVESAAANGGEYQPSTGRQS